jgi:UDP-4-amino-4,6-dideoxy-N-acetyl-beta-L-altrosamine N-acetyltransferase
MSKASADSVQFALLVEQDDDAIERIRTLRNAPGVRMYMYNDHEISREEHVAWVARLRGTNTERVYAVLVQGKVEGLVALNAINHAQKRADWAFYLSEDMQGKGVGGVVEFKLLDLAFGEMGLEKLNCEVLACNPRVIEMHQKFGFTLEGTRRANVIKNGERMDVALLGILPQEWQAVRPRFARLFSTH